MGIKKRGQITIFIILGIILLLSLGLFIYFKQTTTVFTPERVIPPELRPIDNFIGGCVDKVAKEGLNILGANGGFIRFPEEIQSSYYSSLNTNPLFPSIKVPLWHYNGATKIPSENYMKEDIAYYIEQNLDECLNNLDEFKQQFEIVELEPRKVIVELGENSVDVTLDYPLEIISSADAKSTKINEFKSSVPVRLKRVYELAKDIMEEQLKDKFLEYRTIDLLAVDRDIPYTEMEFTCSPKIWYIKDIEAKLKRLLRTNLPVIRVDNTDYIKTNNPYIKNNYVWKVTDLKYSNTHVSFSYQEDWPMQLNIHPNDGPILRSNAQQGSDIMSFFCMHTYHFTYDIKYPVLATIKDDKGRNHDAYTFNFAFEVGVNHNAPDQTNFGITSFDYEAGASSERFCKESTQTLMTIHTFENVSTGSSEAHQEIDDVNISFNCLRFKCKIGASEFGFRGAIAALSAEFPYCINGILKAEKENYEPASKVITTDFEKSESIYLTPIVNLDISAVRHKISYGVAGSEKSLKGDQVMMITFKKDDFKSTAMYPSEEDILGTLKLLAKWDYTYDVEIYLLDDRTILGGYKGQVTIPWGDLKSAKEIRFHVAEFPYTNLPETQFEYISQLPEVSQKLPQPELI